jgi:hypothetical protein
MLVLASSRWGARLERKKKVDGALESKQIKLKKVASLCLSTVNIIIND